MCKPLFKIQHFVLCDLGSRARVRERRPQLQTAAQGLVFGVRECQRTCTFLLKI